MKIKEKIIWDYNLKQEDLKNPEIYKWYLERKINFGDWSKINKKYLKKYLPNLKIDPKMKRLLSEYFNYYGQ